MSFTVRGLAQGPALGDFVERVRHQRRIMLWIFVGLAVCFVLVGIFAPLVGLLLLAFLLMVGVAVVTYSRRQVHGHGRLVHDRGHRR
ncbi:MAG: hypothetical protein AABY18_08200 [Candidatus Thermoplasmatota archaeon]|mgnify:CR=1 FL=1